MKNNQEAVAEQVRGFVGALPYIQEGEVEVVADDGAVIVNFKENDGERIEMLASDLEDNFGKVKVSDGVQQNGIQLFDKLGHYSEIA